MSHRSFYTLAACERVHEQLSISSAGVCLDLPDFTELALRRRGGGRGEEMRGGAVLEAESENFFV